MCYILDMQNLNKKYINICLVILVFSILLFAWANRWNIYEYKIGEQEVFVKENIYTGVRCTIKEGIVTSGGRLSIKDSYNFPDWCPNLKYLWNM